MASVSNRAKWPVNSYNQEESIAFVRLTAEATDIVPVLTVNGGGIVASVAKTGTGDWLVTLNPRFVYLSCHVNVQGTAYNGKAVCTAGNTTNTIAVKITAENGGTASNPTSEIVDLLIVGVRRTESAA